jgi:hypothetical protein
MEKTEKEVRMDARLSAIQSASSEFMAAYQIADKIGYLAFANGCFSLNVGEPGRFSGVFSEWGDWTRLMKRELDAGTQKIITPPTIPILLGEYATAINAAYEQAGIQMRMAK